MFIYQPNQDIALDPIFSDKLTKRIDSKLVLT